MQRSPLEQAEPPPTRASSWSSSPFSCSRTRADAYGWVSSTVWLGRSGLLLLLLLLLLLPPQ